VGDRDGDVAAAEDEEGGEGEEGIDVGGNRGLDEARSLRRAALPDWVAHVNVRSELGGRSDSLSLRRECQLLWVLSSARAAAAKACVE
jgi:hypothetical protein